MRGSNRLVLSAAPVESVQRHYRFPAGPPQIRPHLPARGTFRKWSHLRAEKRNRQVAGLIRGCHPPPWNRTSSSSRVEGRAIPGNPPSPRNLRKKGHEPREIGLEKHYLYPKRQ